MKLFTELYVELDQTNKTNEKVEALKFYFERAKSEDAAWALYFLSGRKPRQIVPSKKLREWAMDLSGVEPWLYEECYHEIGDGAETIFKTSAAASIVIYKGESYTVESTGTNWKVI